jgi:exodeoxyribonuclease-5
MIKQLPPLSIDQQKVLDAIILWVKIGDKIKPVLTVGGYAGTGKTTILAHLADALPDLRIAFMSLTGKAVSVMKKKLGKYGAVSTIHRFQYTPVIDEKTQEIVGWNHRGMAKDGDDPEDGEIDFVDLIVIDEASMVSDEILVDLLTYERPILGIGDHGQLPSIGDSAGLMDKPELRLEKIHRQAEGNPILKVATIARRKGYLSIKDHSPKVRVIAQANIPPEVEKIFLTPDPDTLIITGSNVQRISINERILAQMGRSEQQRMRPQEGDRVVCLRNDYISGLFNGAQATVKEIKNCYQNFMEVVLQVDGFSHTTECHMAFWAFNQPKPIRPQGRAPGIPFDFGYCLTCHKAQGSESKRVIVVGSGFGDNDMRKRWLYTAVTRAQEELYVLR